MSTESSQDLVELAKQGNAAAIAQLINHALHSKGIAVRVSCQAGCLKIMAEADQIPDPQTLVPYLQKNLTKLQISSVHTVELIGKQTCATAIAWRQSFKLAQLDQAQPSTKPSPLAVTHPPASTRPALAPAPRQYQIVFTGVIALVLVLLGANIRSLHTLITGSPAKPTVQRSLSPTKDGIYRAAIVSRHNGVPVIMVKFNGNYTYPMILDTGAGGTLITTEMARTLGVVPVGQATAQTANGYATFDVGYINSMEVDGARISQVPVAIGLADMTVGLLGHDFFDNFDVTVRAEVVEFHPRNKN